MGYISQMFSTKRLSLRAFQSGDEDKLLSLFNNALVAPMMNDGFVRPHGPKFKETLKEIAEGSLMFCVIEEVEGEAFVGMAGFFNKPEAKNRCGEISIAILPEFWNKGYGTEAIRFMVDHGFHSLALHRISLGVHAINDRAIAVYRKIGFIEEGRIRERVWVNGAWTDAVWMGLLAKEWAEKKRSSASQ
ncbi:acyl-CoA N-acyltransferase [Crucibulum laeve]|uniref:Acyl-CoA N-acyltransferase n=1 Tax=Crucibulum laeve TaxID=68775 RepID=A0A5C3M7A6_9AGAR|nr:acyl-CoA N-acyltransferase [Crucibulum laeve]